MSSFLVNPQNGKVFQEQVRTTGQTIGAGLLALVAAAAAVTVNAPASPADGTVFAVRRSSGSDDITVNGNGLTIDGAASVVLDSAIYEAVFVCDSGAWYRIEPVRSFGASNVFTLPVQRTEDSGGGGGVVPGSPGQVIWNNGGALAGAPQVTTNGNYVGIGDPAGVASDGLVRLPFFTTPTTYLAMRNAANDGDIDILSGEAATVSFMNSSYNLDIRGYAISLFATSIITMYDGTAYTLTLNGGKVYCGGELTGSLTGSPMRYSALPIDLAAAANYALTGADVAYGRIEFTNAAGGAGTTVTSVAGNVPLAEYVVTVFGSNKLVTFLGVVITTGPTDAYKSVTVRRSLTTGTFIGTSTYTG